MRHRITHVGACGKMNHRCDFVFSKNLAHQGSVRDVAFDKCSPTGRIPSASSQVIEHDGLEARRTEQLRSMAPYETAAAGDKDGHCLGLSWPMAGLAAYGRKVPFRRSDPDKTASDSTPGPQSTQT